MRPFWVAATLPLALVGCVAPAADNAPIGPSESESANADAPNTEPTDAGAPCRAGVLRWHQAGLVRELGTNWSVEGALAWVTPARKGWPVRDFAPGQEWGPVNWTELAYRGSMGDNESFRFWITGGPSTPRISAEIDDNQSAPALAAKLQEVLGEATTDSEETRELVIRAMLDNETPMSFHGDDFERGQPVWFHWFHYEAVWPLVVAPERLPTVAAAMGWTVNLTSERLTVGPWILLASGETAESSPGGWGIQSASATAFDDFLYRAANVTDAPSLAAIAEAWLMGYGLRLEPETSTSEEVDWWTCPPGQEDG